MKLVSKTLLLVMAVTVFASNAEAGFTFWWWKRKYPRYARAFYTAEDLGTAQMFAARGAEQRCIEVGKGKPYGKYFYDCRGIGRVSVLNECWAYVPCDQ
jgi:hypothetical protein